MGPNSKKWSVLPIIGDGFTRFQPVYVIDVAAAIIAALKDDGASIGRTYELGGPDVFTIDQLVHLMFVSLIGYCADGDQSLLVYEYLPFGSLEDHLLDLLPDKKPLDWNTRMKIAAGAARGLEYLHDKANPPVIYRDFKSSNILLDEEFHPKLSSSWIGTLFMAIDPESREVIHKMGAP